jgi:hypothetical protein
VGPTVRRPPALLDWSKYMPFVLSLGRSVVRGETTRRNHPSRSTGPATAEPTTVDRGSFSLSQSEGQCSCRSHCRCRRDDVAQIDITVDVNRAALNRRPKRPFNLSAVTRIILVSMCRLIRHRCRIVQSADIVVQSAVKCNRIAMSDLAVTPSLIVKL